MKALNIVISIVFSIALTCPAFSQDNQKLTRKQLEKLEEQKRADLKQKADSVIAVLNSAKSKQERKEKNITIQEAGDDNFKSLLSSNTIVVADFAITACAACIAAEPLLVDMQAKYDGKIKVVRYDGDRNRKIMREQKIEYYPTVLIFKEGKVIGRLSGGYNILVYLEEEITKALK